MSAGSTDARPAAARFLPSAADAGHLVDLGRWVLTRACADIVALGRPQPLAALYLSSWRRPAVG